MSIDITSALFKLSLSLLILNFQCNIWFNARFIVSSKFRLDDLFSFEFFFEHDNKTVGVNIEFKSVCEAEVEQVSDIIQRSFPAKQREDFAKAIIAKYPMEKFATLQSSDLINPFARQLRALYESNTVHTYQTNLANDMYFGDTFLFISGWLYSIAYTNESL